MREISNLDLGNFGFLLDFGQEFLFEFAQRAESNLYVNKRLCAVYIRQLTESFFDVVIDRYGIPIWKKSLSDGRSEVASIYDKQVALCHYFNDPVRRTGFGQKIFPRYPGRLNDPNARLECPEGEGDNKIWGSDELVDSSMRTLYVWDFIRRLGNAGSHAVLSQENVRWLTEENIKTALEQLCLRMREYFYRSNNKEVTGAYCEKNASLASRVIYYPLAGESELRYPGQKWLPGCSESIYYTVMPKKSLCEGKSIWYNYLNKYSIIRKYAIEDKKGIQDFLLQAQKAYLILQEKGALKGIAPFSVLADLRDGGDYYVTAYEFDNRPETLCREKLLEYGIYADENKLLDILLQFLSSMERLTENHIYHRNLTHDSIKLCRCGQDGIETRLIDFEFVKLFETEEFDDATVFQYANEKVGNAVQEHERGGNNDWNENLRQYEFAVWDESTTEEKYREEQKRRVGMILCNLLCPDHLDNSRKFSHVATGDEIFAEDNALWMTKQMEREKIERIYAVACRLMNDGDYSIEQAQGDLY